jgi:hypothetical protein
MDSPGLNQTRPGSRARASAVREALLAAAGGVTGVGPAAGGMSAPHGSMTAFNDMRDGYLAHLALADETSRAADLRAYCIDSGPG